MSRPRAEDPTLEGGRPTHRRRRPPKVQGGGEVGPRGPAAGPPGVGVVRLADVRRTAEARVDLAADVARPVVGERVHRPGENGDARPGRTPRATGGARRARRASGRPRPPSPRVEWPAWPPAWHARRGERSRPDQALRVGTPYLRASPRTRQWKIGFPAQALKAAGKTWAGPRGGRPPPPSTSNRRASRHGRSARPAALHRSRGQDHWWSTPKRTRRPARVASTRDANIVSRSVSRVNGPLTLRGRPPRSSVHSAIARRWAEGDAAPL